MRSSFDDAVLCFLRALFKILGIVLRPPLDAKPRRHTDGAADECDCDRPGFELGSHMSSPKCLAVNLDSYPGDVIPFGAEGVEQHGRCKRYARARYFGDHSVETQGSGAPCLLSWFLQDQSNCGLQELLYPLARRQDNFHGKLKREDRLVQAQLPMSSRSARISLARPHE